MGWRKYPNTKLTEGFINTGWGQAVFSLASGSEKPTLLLSHMNLLSYIYIQAERD